MFGINRRRGVASGGLPLQPEFEAFDRERRIPIPRGRAFLFAKCYRPFDLTEIVCTPTAGCEVTTGRDLPQRPECSGRHDQADQRAGPAAGSDARHTQRAKESPGRAGVLVTDKRERLVS
jgi:hypothetical protein